MKKTIWKFELTTVGRIEMPVGAEVLCVQTQGNTPCIWAIVDPTLGHEWRTFKAYGTGHDLPENPGKYIGTFQLGGGALVFHVFEE